MEVKPGYKLTEVGVIPEEWSVRRLKDCCQKLNVSFVGTCEPFYTRENTGVLMLRTGNLQGDQIVLDGCKFVTREFHARNRKSQVRTGDILIARHGNSGNAVPVPAGIDDVNALSIVILRTNEAILGHRFACYCINSGAVRSQTAGMLAGSTQVIINTREVEKLRLPLPPLPEQRAIATALSDVDGLLCGLDRLIAKKRDLKQAAMQQLLTGQTRLPSFHGEWEVKRLGSVADVLKGNALSKSLVSASGTRPCILYGELFTNYGRVISEIVGRTNSNEGCLSVFGDVLMPGSTTTTGADLATASALLLDNVALGGDIIVIRRRDQGYDPIFLANYLTQARRHDIAELTQGITIHHLYGKDVKTLSLRLPSLAEQTAIAEVLSEMDGELGKLEERREKTRALKQAMMQELLTGRTRLL